MDYKNNVIYIPEAKPVYTSRYSTTNAGLWLGIGLLVILIIIFACLGCSESFRNGLKESFGIGSKNPKFNNSSYFQYDLPQISNSMPTDPNFPAQNIQMVPLPNWIKARGNDFRRPPALNLVKPGQSMFSKEQAQKFNLPVEPTNSVDKLEKQMMKETDEENEKFKSGLSMFAKEYSQKYGNTGNTGKKEGFKPPMPKTILRSGPKATTKATTRATAKPTARATARATARPIVRTVVR